MNASIEELLILNLMTAGGNLPVTSVPVFINAAAFPADDTYVPFYRNTYERVVALRVKTTDLGGGGVVQLSLENNRNGIIDTLTTAGSGKFTSDTIWLMPLQTLYIGYNPFDGVPTGTFKVLLFDPLVALKR